MPAKFPYEEYETLAEPMTMYYPTGAETRARWVVQAVNTACALLSQLFERLLPTMEIVLVKDADWQLAPREEDEEIGSQQPYWTDVTHPPSLVVPAKIDPIFGEQTERKTAFMLYHEVALAFLEEDPRPWPNDYPLWADEWQFKFAALWLSQRIDGVQGVVNTDLQEAYADIFEPEPDGKAPVTVRGFNWYEDTSSEDYLAYQLLLEQFAADLLASYGPEILPRFLTLYRTDRNVLLSEDVTNMLVSALGPNGAEWLESLIYF